MTLAEYERQPGFKQRAAVAEEEVLLCLATAQDIDGSEIIRTLKVPPPIAIQWLGSLMVKLGETRITFTVADDDRGLPQ